MENNTKKYRSYNAAPIWGIFLLFLGIVLLLQTFNVLPWDLWETLWRFWPALIIMVGLAILFRNFNIWLISFLAVIILGGSLGLAIWQNNNMQREISIKNYSQPITDLEQSLVAIDFTAGQLTIADLPVTSVSLFEAQVEARNDISSMDVNFDQEGKLGRLSLDSINQQHWPTGGISWNVDFTTKIPITFDIKSTASTNKLELGTLKISDFHLNTNASTSDINLPSPFGIMSVKIEANAATVDITIPDNAQAKVEVTTNVGTFNIDNRFIKEGNYYMTKNYNNASDHIELEIRSNVSTVTIN
jgi:hypothetical protein